MIQPVETLLKYDEPVLIKTRVVNGKSSNGHHLRGSPQSFDESEVTPLPPTSQCASKMTKEKILDMIFPPREWTEGNESWVQKVSRASSSRADVLRLEKLLDTKLEERDARQGICPVSRELYSQCFDELIRQVTIMSPESGLLLLRVRNEINMTFEIFQKLYVSSMAYGVRKRMYAKAGQILHEKKVADLENEIQDLKKQLNELKLSYDVLEKRQSQENNLTVEMKLLEKKNQQLLMLLQEKWSPMK